MNIRQSFVLRNVLLHWLTNVIQEQKKILFSKCQSIILLNHHVPLSTVPLILENWYQVSHSILKFLIWSHGVIGYRVSCHRVCGQSIHFSQYKQQMAWQPNSMIFNWYIFKWYPVKGYGVSSEQREWRADDTFTPPAATKCESFSSWNLFTFGRCWRGEKCHLPVTCVAR